jgi:probable rRNA maturation factor
VIRVQIANHQTAVAVDRRKLRQAVRMVLQGEGIDEADISLAVVDDAAIRQLHRRYLGQDEPTDVLSFLLDREGGRLDGEIVVSGETAGRAAPEYGCTAAQELLLYVIHGALHLAGWNDDTPKKRAEMWGRQRDYLARLGRASEK